jgi:hypothetical protein
MNNSVWIYLSNKAFDAQTEESLKKDIETFLKDWNAHGKALTASYEILHHHFIVIKADEEQYAASGCSIDKQFQFIKEVEKKYKLSLLDRLQVAYKDGNEVRVTHSSKIPQLLQEKTLNENTMVYNTAVSNDAAYKTSFEIPLKQSWLSKFLLTV